MNASRPSLARWFAGLACVLAAPAMSGQSPALFQHSGQFLSPAVGGNWSRDAALGDVDGDGDLDALVAQGGGSGPETPQPNIIWLNNGSGSFSEGANRVGSGDDTRTPQSIELKDNDGRVLFVQTEM